MTTYFIADMHFGDERYTTGSNARPFRDVAAMDAAIVRRWNAIVGEGDVVWVLGDVAKRGHMRKVAALRGTKKLVLGNRDDAHEAVASGLFARVYSIKVLGRRVLSHAPVHPSQLAAGMVNVHGHTHRNAIGDPRYICVSVDQTDFGPVEVAERSEAVLLPNVDPIRHPAPP